MGKWRRGEHLHAGRRDATHIGNEHLRRRILLGQMEQSEAIKRQLTRLTCVVVFSLARWSSANAAAFCAPGSGDESQPITGGMPPYLAIASWFAWLSAQSVEIADMTRTARSATLPLSSATRRFATDERFSVCFAASDASAPAALAADFSDAPLTIKPTSGSMPPSLAIVALFGVFSFESDQRAEAACSFVSGEPSRTSVHRGAMAPVRAMAAWFSGLPRARAERAPLAFA